MIDEGGSTKLEEEKVSEDTACVCWAGHGGSTVYSLKQQQWTVICSVITVETLDPLQWHEQSSSIQIHMIGNTQLFLYNYNIQVYNFKENVALRWQSYS